MSDQLNKSAEMTKLIDLNTSKEIYTGEDIAAQIELNEKQV